MNTLYRRMIAWCVAAVVAIGAGASAEAAIADHVTRIKASGVDLLTYPMGAKDVVTIVGAFPAGDYFSALPGSNPAIATLTGMMLDKGTTHRDKFAIAKELDDVGATLGFDVSTQSVGVRGKALKKDVPLIIRIMAEELREPAFSAEEFAKVKKQFIGMMRPAQESPGFRARESFLLSMYPAGSPNRPVPLQEMLAAADKATLDEVKAFYRKYYGPAHFTLVFVGDVDTKSIQSSVTKAFAGWSGGTDDVRRAPAAHLAAAEDHKVPIADKPSVSLTLGQPTGLRYTDADTLPLRVGTAILGSGFTSRLMGTVRDKEGLTYGISSSVGDDEFVDGTWSIGATFAPALLEKGITSTQRELQKWWESGVTAQELVERKTNMIGTYEVSLSTTNGMAGQILLTLERGKPLSWLDDLPKALNSLTAAQVNGVIRKYLDPKKMVMIQAGSLEEQDKK
ncbi:MAG TPA: pitrilysin family protein [Steroidobacteraceae bacterium]|jgi:zinc protease